MSAANDNFIVFLASPTLLEELAKLLPLVKLSKKKLQYPRSLEQNLQSTYKDLIYDAK